MKKNSVFLTIVGICLIAFITLFLIQKPIKGFTVLSLKQEHNYVINDLDEKIMIPLYISETKVFLVDINNVSDSYLYSKKSGDHIQVEISSIINVDKQVIYNDKEYHEFQFFLTFPFLILNTPTYIDEAYLHISYQNQEFDLLVGNMNIFYNQYPNNDVLSFNKLSGVFNEVNGVDTLVGINLGLVILNEQPIKITNISIYNANYFLDMENIMFEYIDFNDSLFDWYGADYQYVRNKESSLKIIDVKVNYLELFIPVVYVNNLKFVSTLPMFIEYEQDLCRYTYVIDDFCFVKKNDLFSVYEVNEYEYHYQELD